MLHLGVITIMPDMFAALNYGITGRALTTGVARVDCWNPRDWSQAPHCSVDDKPYGGGPGMVMLYWPLHQAICAARLQMPHNTRTIYLSPQGQRLTQAKLNQVAADKQPLLFIAGRYEGIDERVIQADVDEEWSVGDFVLSGGELAAMVCIDGLIRLLPGSLGDETSATYDTFMTGMVDHPHYTRPASIDGRDVPAVLLNGNHAAIERWRRKQALGNTWLKRPDLLAVAEMAQQLSNKDKQLLDEFKSEEQTNE